MFDAVYVRDLADYIAELYIIEYFMSLEHESPVKVELIMTSLLSHPSNITKHGTISTSSYTGSSFP